MSLVVKLKREGSIRKPFFRVVISESSKSKVVDSIGYIKYNHFFPADRVYVCVDFDKLSFWMEQGALVKGRIKKILLGRKWN